MVSYKQFRFMSVALQAHTSVISDVTDMGRGKRVMVAAAESGKVKEAR